MKIRGDFVSNSSSSSFILKDAGFFRYFGLSKEDIAAAIEELSGLKRGEGFCVYDMTDEKDRAECFAEWDGHFSDWFAPLEGEYEKWDTFIDILRHECDFFNVMDIANGEDGELEASNYDRASDKWNREPFEGGAKFVRYVKEKLGVKTMKEVLHDPCCTLMIHFDDNRVHEIEGMSEEGAEDIARRNDSGLESVTGTKYVSEMYSEARFFEILIRHLAEKGKIDLSDPGLMEYWKVPENHWWKTDPEHKDRKFFTETDETAAWNDVYADMLNCNAVMHEG